ncbi:MAG: hypothetical protein KA004_00855 [Verrucomicrobiales bacterium]|nr:hypothetical protein [Verrucomicrobiales bacterium]
MSQWQTVSARIVPGYQIASGRSGNPRFPGGTLQMQHPHFARLGLDLTPFHPGTLNVSIAPARYTVGQARHTFRAVKWHTTEPAEDFSFFQVRLVREGGSAVDGLIYYPHPATKPEHLQPPDVLELLLPFVQGLAYGDPVLLEIPQEQMSIHL